MKKQNPFIISHVGANEGTPDYFADFLRKKKIEYFSLEHPFSPKGGAQSKLTYFNGSSSSTVSVYWTPQNEVLRLIINFLISLSVVIRYSPQISTVIGFGSFNVFPGVLLKPFFKFKTYFFALDYSTRRYGSAIMNLLYRFFETAGCKYANLVINVSRRQEMVRIEKHGLSKERALLISNGISRIGNYVLAKATSEAFLYIGSLSSQHGIVQLVEDHYVNGGVRTPLYIFGGGELEDKLVKLINSTSIASCVRYYGRMSADRIVKILATENVGLVGLAPYRMDQERHHVYYADSLKVKEYIEWGIPFLSSGIIEVPGDLKKFGAEYITQDSLREYLQNPRLVSQLNILEVSPILENYEWDKLLSRIPLS